ncbi:MAG: redox-regulated ATPase YchF [Gemmatimonadota bacterium]
MLQVGIVGLPNVGKSTLFNALTAAGAPAENYPFCTVEPNVGTVEVPDSRLERVRALMGAPAAIPAVIRFVDIAGLVSGASEGEGLGNRFLGQIREVDAVVHVLRCFADPDVAHVMGGVDPLRDLEVVEAELALADLETLERRMEKVEKKARSGESDAILEKTVLDRFKADLSRGRPLRRLCLEAGERAVVRELNLLTAKPTLYVANLPEGVTGEDSPVFESLVEAGVGTGVNESLVGISSAIEAELALLDPEERDLFLQEMDLDESGLERVIRASYELLGLITFFTSNEREARAWTVRRGTRAPEAAGVIHTDFQRGFIRAETIGYAELESVGGMKLAREGGVVRSEGKEYEVQDGELILFRFNV